MMSIFFLTRFCFWVSLLMLSGFLAIVYLVPKHIFKLSPTKLLLDGSYML